MFIMIHKEITMARTARIVAPDHPHHIIQRGNRKQPVFFSEKDFRKYIDIMAEKTKKYDVEIWSYCLMTNHIHLIAVPRQENALANAIGEAHKEYTKFINKREGWSGFLWQGRFSSYPMNERYFVATCRYIEMNPVKAGIVINPFDYKWSSAKAHLMGKDDKLVSVEPALSVIGSWEDFLTIKDELMEDTIQSHIKSGKPFGNI